MEKALREAGVNTSWVEPNEAHEQAVRAGIARFYERLPEDFEAFVRRVAEEGRRVSLAQTLLKLTVPGVPDIYQGDELECAQPRRPGQPAAGRLGGAPARARRSAAEDAPHSARARPAAAAAGGVRRRLRAVDVGPDACVFERGEGEVLVAVALNRRGLQLDFGSSERLRDVLCDEARTSGFGPSWADGIAVLERA